jgi:hypothetical protein
MNQSPRAVIALRLDAEIAEGLRTLAACEGRDPHEQVVWLILEALVKANLLPPGLRDWIQRRERLIQRFGVKAVEITKTEGWRADIIVETARRLMREHAGWRADYAALIDADPYEKRIKAKERINPMLGRRVKLLLRADTGKPFAVKESIFTTASHLIEPKQAAA